MRFLLVIVGCVLLLSVLQVHAGKRKKKSNEEELFDSVDFVSVKTFLAFQVVQVFL